LHLIVNAMGRLKEIYTPTQLSAFFFVYILITAFLVMWGLHFLSHAKEMNMQPLYSEFLIDSFALAIFILPGIYLFAYKPLRNKYIELSAFHNTLSVSEQNYREIVESTDDLIAKVGSNENIMMVNNKAINTFGLSSEESIGRSVFSFIHTDDRKKTRKLFNYLVKSKSAVGHFENRLVSNDGRVSHMLWASNIHYDDTGEVKFINNIGRDITERKKAEEALTQALDNKDMLIREVHHRMKNNLAVIQSLLSLQVKDVTDEKSKGYLLDAENRMHSMAMIHEMLHGSNDLKSLKTRVYIEKLVGTLTQNYKLDTQSIKLQCDIQDISLDVDTMIPLGLIVNELVSNALKHAFPDDTNGELTVSLTKTEESGYVLVIKDNGIGLPEDFDLMKANSLGLKIVKSLVRQIKGIFEIPNRDGAEFVIVFKEKLLA